MTTRVPLRECWVRHVARTKTVKNETRALLIGLAVSPEKRMTLAGRSRLTTADLARMFGVPEARIVLRLQQAQDAGLLTATPGGWQAVIPDEADR